MSTRVTAVIFTGDRVSGRLVTDYSLSDVGMPLFIADKGYPVDWVEIARLEPLTDDEIWNMYASQADPAALLAMGRDMLVRHIRYLNRREDAESAADVILRIARSRCESCEDLLPIPEGED